MIYLPDGLAREGVERGVYCEWWPPARTAGQRVTGLRVLNSLTGEKELFVPKHGNRVTWYTCGPTVYDVCHMGHARAYLTMDIMRRILEDYFGYDVFMQVNVTDIDDKIIARARRNKLLDDYVAQALPREQVISDVSKAMEAFETKQVAKLTKLEMPLATSREEEERKELLKQHVQKMARFATDKEALLATQASGADGAAIARAAFEPLSEALDAELGDAVTDQTVFNAHARKFEQSFLEDMAALNIRSVDVLSRVTEYVPQVIDFIRVIVDKGLAYESNGSVYMDIGACRSKGHVYPKLEPSKAKATQAEMEESEGAHKADDDEKRGKGDFALWKKSKGGEPSWESPWGGGRPGWHIECSVMASDSFKDNMDIHAGGVDLKFPHHDNELCQSEAFHGCAQWVNYFFHFGHLHIAGLKMAKSLKNFITIRQALTGHTARQIRLMFLMHPWDKPINYSDQTLDSAKSKEERLETFFREVKALLRTDWASNDLRPGPAERSFLDAMAVHQQEAHECLMDNLNTPGAMAAIFEIVGDSFSYLKEVVVPNALCLKKAAVYVTRMLRVFGVATQDEFGLPIASAEGGGDREQVLGPVLDVLSGFRDQVRSLARDLPAAQMQEMLSLCDVVRDRQLVDCGVRLEDKAAGGQWSLADPAVMLAEAAAKEAERAEATATKVMRKMQAKAAEISKEGAAALQPSALFDQEPHASKYSADRDADGKPLKAKGGEELSKAAKKEVDKLFAKQEKAHAEHLKKLDAKPQLIDELKAQLAELRSQLAASVSAGEGVLGEEVLGMLNDALAAVAIS
uniref:cysteine--tRNA ligase n=1 Tax=Coccolithus braarudii TaxID=221442 RepID=A0A7S0LM51_9EUKA|mmetsp:Transcript_47954/g.102433  ORF Transcript_47954/g.102433 Transcript_47954/m.102433 type:complete len:802 (+) Transcript_47954:25-2430(+)|eukprot:CAMPEP_0183378910 /NCGR_PEP_ID=MMETSP0164_2-20130417/125156_1 /TAXON_ID=221442 /ORGANISM="Coccolithus pelagicus ssp braarudi, Strain PLY182g" /LENGTH=801 /DNA_ID=CAMNT_0025556483 /DNA_START=12 /DNA_END=2417 /DNA_ORIENTATION=-